MTKQLLFRTLLGDYTVQQGTAKKGTAGREPENDQETLDCVDAFSKTANLAELRKKNISLTKKQIQGSFSEDQLIIYAVNAMDDLRKHINNLLGRLSEWYSTVDPEAASKLRKDVKLADAVLGKTGRSDMGVSLAKQDRQVLEQFADSIRAMDKEHSVLNRYMESLLGRIAPNLTEIAGPLIAAKLIQHAGSLKHLSELPSTTLQLLGAETALFRHIRTGAKPPKYGLISQHPLISNARKQHHGKLARLLADKLIIAARVDYFKGKPVAKEMKKDLESRAKKITGGKR